MTDVVEVMARGMMQADTPPSRNRKEAFRNLAEDALAALNEAGYVVVPREPTEAMRIAGFDSGHIHQSLPSTLRVTPIYRAMLSAAQPAPK